MRPVFRTISFWACVAMSFINLVLLFIAKALHQPQLMSLAMMTMFACVVGAGAHWYLDRACQKERERDQSKPRR